MPSCTDIGLNTKVEVVFIAIVLLNLTMTQGYVI